MLIVAGSLLYSWHVDRGIKADEARTQRFLQQLEINKGTLATLQPEETDIPTRGLSRAPATGASHETMSEETDALPIDGADGDLNLTNTFLPDDTASEEETAEVPVSPHGFGPYPEVPANYPGTVNWDDYRNDSNPIFELMERVKIKLWTEQGVYAEGMTGDHNRVYPIVRGIVMVGWSHDGTHIQRTLGHPADNLQEITEEIETGSIPSGITVVDYESAGLDPYFFLGLDK